ncbi:Holliday junction resolvase RecU [Lysinibacillus sp. KCTC 33748]|uniref:Holliday junction resolvase RecU n=1 Tax=unclassified Lysinibacillus TaxID=2636778 RepID=UPI0009A7EC4E|nr:MULTISPECIES: Holliday junction resolvase RecU [unclassified Lysinibacillus]OXS76122.1 Holliday junction resolvase RecU [Lysinibacillus sp. KCTC 33748]SKB41010.1 recombination protein U [Lysinibacillus sp. AC-3]
MTIRYPNGKLYSPNPTVQKTVKKGKEKDVSFSNRGKTLEDEIDEANDYYVKRRLAIIHKKPVPVQIVKVEYPSRSAAVIREAYFRTPSTTDYNGVWNGRYIDFDAKETASKTSFPLKNIHLHQMTHMQQVTEQNGVAFIIVRFSAFERYFIVPYDVLQKAWLAMENGERKSIPFSTIEKEAFEIPTSYYPRIDYLPIIQQLIEAQSHGSESEEIVE